MSYKNLLDEDKGLRDLWFKADSNNSTYMSLWTNDILLDGHWDYASLPALIEMLNYIVKNYKDKNAD